MYRIFQLFTNEQGTQYATNVASSKQLFTNEQGMQQM